MGGTCTERPGCRAAGVRSAGVPHPTPAAGCVSALGRWRCEPTSQALAPGSLTLSCVQTRGRRTNKCRRDGGRRFAPLKRIMLWTQTRTFALGRRDPGLLERTSVTCGVPVCGPKFEAPCASWQRPLRERGDSGGSQRSGGCNSRPSLCAHVCPQAERWLDGDTQWWWRVLQLSPRNREDGRSVHGLFQGKGVSSCDSLARDKNV